MIYLADHRPEKNSDEYTESLLWFYLFCDRIISRAQLVHICSITNLHVSAPNLPHSSVCFRLKQSKLVKKWHPSMQVRNAEYGRLESFIEPVASCVETFSLSLNSSTWSVNYTVKNKGSVMNPSGSRDWSNTVKTFLSDAWTFFPYNGLVVYHLISL
jgi:hypothetical protein